MRKLMVGMDLHSNNLMVGLVDMDGKRIKHQKIECDLKKVLQFLKPFKSRIDTVAVESTFNWYWLVDGLVEENYNAVLANPAKIEQYSGLKHGDDESDAYFLAELLRLKILPTGYIYDPKLRPIRDLLRRRGSLVRQRTALMLSFKSLYARTTGQEMGLSRLKAMEVKEAEELYAHPANQLIAKLQKEHIEKLDESIKAIEKTVLKTALVLPMYSRLKTVPGIGVILALTISMEIGDIQRFPDAGDFASYCRMVNAQRFSNGIKKGENNRKCGNKYLSWAFVEASNFAKRFDVDSRRWFDRKAAKTNKVLATKALGCKISKACWHVIKEDADYDPKRIFPSRVVAAQN